MASYAYWASALGRSPAAVGATVTVNGVPAAIVGVLPPGFSGVVPGQAPQIYGPLTAPFLEPFGGWGDATHGKLTSNWYWVNLIGRVRPGLGPAQAQAMAAAAFRAFSTRNIRQRPFPRISPA